MTVAAHRIEGWNPTDEHLTALAALSRGDMSFGDYFAVFRARQPPPQRYRRRPGLRRPVPYFIPGTTVLRNNFGAVSADVLTDLELTATAGRMVQWLQHPAARGSSDPLDVRALHRHLFADAYAWAGEYRTTDLRRGEQGFAWQSTINARMTELHRSVHEVVNAGGVYDDPRLSYELARIYADFNQIHPFREGNGRTGALLLHTVAQTCGRRLELNDVSRGAWYSAAVDSMPFRRDGRASHRPFLYLLGPALRPD
jgi:cell filamentation protein